MGLLHPHGGANLSHGGRAVYQYVLLCALVVISASWALAFSTSCHCLRCQCRAFAAGKVSQGDSIPPIMILMASRCRFSSIFD